VQVLCASQKTRTGRRASKAGLKEVFGTPKNKQGKRERTWRKKNERGTGISFWAESAENSLSSVASCQKLA
jgi:hypothetical protein